MKEISKKAMRMHPYLIRYTIFIFVGIIMNLLGCAINSILPIRLHLDTVGTLLCAIIGGVFPSTIIAMATIILKEYFFKQEMYYSLTNMVIALLGSSIARRYLKEKSAKVLITVPIFAVLSGFLNTVMMYYSNEYTTGKNANCFVLYFQQNTKLSEFEALFVGNMVIEIIDKLIIVSVAIVMFLVCPSFIRNAFQHTRIWQNSLPKYVEKKIRTARCRTLSIRTKMFFIVNSSVFIIAICAFVISYSMFKNNSIREHIDLAQGICNTIASIIEPSRVDEYMKNGESDPEYCHIKDMLKLFYKNSKNVEFVYVYKIMEDGCHTVFDVGADDVEAGKPGEVVLFDLAFKDCIPDLLAGKEIEPIVTNDTYGYLLTVYEPVYGDDGVCECYACVDVSMNSLGNTWKMFILNLIYMLGGITILEIVVSQWIITKSVINPINSIAHITSLFAYDCEEVRKKNIKMLEKLDVRTGDEIENLYHNIVKTTQRTTKYLSAIHRKNKTISEMQKGLIMALAELVESRDKSTGNHIRKTSAYVQIIVEEMKKRGYYKKRMTDEFCKNVIDAAPLHDIGKIHVPDSILTKPDKLTAEEFKIMQRHTITGGRIMERIIKMTPNATHLQEAKRLAEYHHEKWDGSGYPHGISGYAIPLSARIMAVADVFDALVSRRCYKEPLSFEQAVSIITEGRGTHFDPLVVDAFLGAKDSIRKVAEEFEGNC
ncbi:MAG: HD domain-containing protein [Clostridia bacterium]|nr:HD domain-containing protein [Clostridia bacterium]